MKPRFRLPLLAAALAAAACAAQAQTPPASPAPQSGAHAMTQSEMEKAGSMTAQAWLQLLDRRDWGTAWDTSASVFRSKVPLGTWMDNVPKVRDPFGRFVEREPGEVVYRRSLPGMPDADYVSVAFHSKFEKNPQVTEVVTTVREPDGRWRVTGYTAR